MLELQVRVVARRDEAEDICSFLLERVDGSPLPAYSAGAHIDVEVRPGLVRQYSLCGEPGDHRWRIGVLKEPASRGGSLGMHEVREGGMLRVGLPRNQFALVEAPHVILMAGGIGITPILAMAKELQAAGRSFELHYCARSAERMAFSSEIAASAFATSSRTYHDVGTTERFDARSVLAASPDESHLFVCGPAGFIGHVIDTARTSGWAEPRLHREHFSAPAQNASGDQTFEIRLAKSGSSHMVPAGRTAMEVLLEARVDVPSSCEAGVCGTCITRVLDGVPDHRDSFMTDAEHAANDQFTPCCSRSKSAVLILDL